MQMNKFNQILLLCVLILSPTLCRGDEGRTHREECGLGLNKRPCSINPRPCSSAKGSTRSVMLCGDTPPDILAEHRIEIGDTFAWQEKSPTDFLELLKSADSYTIGCFHYGWIKFSDVQPLIDMLDSEEKCGSVVVELSSLRPLSTIGNEAAYLIEGFRTGVYPPDLNPNCRKIDKENIRHWWKNQKGETEE